MKRYRIYFNYRSTAPVVWAVDEGTPGSEVHVQRIDLAPGVGASSNFNPDAPKGEPSAWFDVEANLDIHGGVAYFTGRNGSLADSLPLGLPGQRLT